MSLVVQTGLMGQKDQRGDRWVKYSVGKRHDRQIRTRHLVGRRSRVIGDD
jgi:hypothetical protein